MGCAFEEWHPIVFYGCLSGLNIDRVVNNNIVWQWNCSFVWRRCRSVYWSSSWAQGHTVALKWSACYSRVLQIWLAVPFQGVTSIEQQYVALPHASGRLWCWLLCWTLQSSSGRGESVAHVAVARALQYCAVNMRKSAKCGEFCCLFETKDCIQFKFSTGYLIYVHCNIFFISS